MATIDLSNYDTTLVQSSASRSGSPNGNVFFDVTNGRIELITAEELANITYYQDIAGVNAVQVDVNATTGTFTIVGGTNWEDYITSPSPGGHFTTTLYTNGGNNNTFQVASIVGAVLTVVDNTGMVTETGDNTESFASATTANPLIENDGIKLEALYAFERQERRRDEVLRQYDYYFKGTFKFGGAYEVVNGRKFDDADGSATSLTTDDRYKVRGSGWIERNAAGAIGRIYYGVISLGNIEALSQPYYQLLQGALGAPVNFDKDGPIDEAVQVYGDNDIDANAYTTTTATAAAQTISVVAASGTFSRSAGDYLADGFEVGQRFDAAGLANNLGTYTIDTVTATVITIVADEWASLTDETGNADEVLTVTGFDRRLYLSNKVRTFGNNYDEKILADSGVSQMDGYATGFALGESTHLTTGTYTLANVYGGSQISPWTGMTLEELDVAQTETGFTTADGDFTWVLNNSVPGNLDQCVAYLDAIAQTDNDINAHATNVTRGKRVGTWYTYNAEGKILPRTNIAGEGLFIEGLIGTDKNRVIFTDDAGATKEYPAYSAVSVTVGANAVADTLAWFHAFFLDGPGANDFNTSGAVTVQDADGVTLIKGNVATSPLRTGNDINFEFDHAGDTLGGTAGTDKDCVFECEGDGGVTAAKTIFTLTSAASITATCIPSVETNV